MSQRCVGGRSFGEAAGGGRGGRVLVGRHCFAARTFFFGILEGFMEIQMGDSVLDHHLRPFALLHLGSICLLPDELILAQRPMLMAYLVCSS